LYVAGVCYPNPLAADVVNSLKEEGYRLILASDPTTPNESQIIRTRWAGLNPDDFELITSFEDFHHCKPNLRYYQEILDIQNLKADECIMVGNDIVCDMTANKLGLDVFLITAESQEKYCYDASIYKSGSLQDFCDFMTK